MKIDLSSNVRDVVGDVDLLFNDQVPFAIAKALTDTARQISAAMPAELESALDRPIDFTRRGFYVQPARKTDPQAVVGVKDVQARYLGYQIEGGSRKPTRKALRLPAKVELDGYGNMPKGLVKQLIARAKQGKRATKSQAARFGVSQEDALFYGDPGGGKPPGIYQRIHTGARRQLVPVVVFPQQEAAYSPRFDFGGAAGRVAEQRFEAALDAAMEQAIATKK
jgi:hypothetical protein